MSNKIVMDFEVTSMLIMKETLKRLGHSFTEKGNQLSIQRAYNNITISQNGVTFDSANRAEVDRIKVEYQRDFQVNERTVRGEVFEVTETKDEIVIMVS